MKSTLELLKVLIFRGGGAIGSILLSFLVARIAGAEGLGQFTVFIGLIGVGKILAQRGLDMIVIRTVVKMRMNDDNKQQVTIFLDSIWQTLWSTAIVTFIGMFLLSSGLFGLPIAGAVPSYFFALPMFTWLRLFTGYMKGTDRVWVAPLFEIGGVSLLASILLIFTLVLGFEVRDKVTYLIVATLILLCIIAAVIVIQDRIKLDQQRWFSKKKKVNQYQLSHGQLDFTMISLCGFLIQAGSFTLVSPFLTESDLGLLRAAERLALIISFPVLAIDPYISPKVVRLVNSQDQYNLRFLLLKSILAAFMLAAPFLLLLLTIPEHILGLMGSEFVAAVPYLYIMASAHFFLALLGPFAAVLNLGGEERASMWISVSTFITAFILYPVMASFFGAIGFAIAYVGVSLIRATVMAIIVMRRILR